MTKEGQQVLTKGERRKLAKQQRVSEAEQKGRQQLARRTLFAAGGGGLLVLAGVAFSRRNDGQAPASAAPQAEPRDNPDDLRAVLKNEVTKREIRISQKEQELWAKNGFAPNPNTPVNPQTQQEAAGKVKRALSLMLLSENPHMKQTAEYLKGANESGDVRFNITPGIVNDKSLEGTNNIVVMSTGFEVENGKPYWFINVPADHVLRRASAEDLALSFVHETQHIINGNQLHEQLGPNITVEQRREFEKGRRQDTQTRIAEESSAHAKEAEAAIYHLGLTGRLPSNSLQDTAMYATYGANSDDPRWKTYIATELLRIPPRTN